MAINEFHTSSLPNGLAAQIAREALNTRKRILRRDFKDESIQSIAQKFLGIREIAKSRLSIVLPILAALGVGIIGYRNIKSSGQDLEVNPDTIDNIEKVDKTIDKRTIEIISEKYKNVKLLNSTPTSKVTNPQRMDDRIDNHPVNIVDHETFSNNLQIYCEEHGCTSKEAFKIAELAGGFVKSEMTEEMNVLKATQDLRKRFYLTPKPAIKWAQRKSDGVNVTVGDILGVHYPNLSFRDKILSNLEPKEWWEAFYKEDAEAGRIGESDISSKGKDAAFRMAYIRQLGVKSLGNLFAEPPIEARIEAFAKVLGSSDSISASRFLNLSGRPKAQGTSQSASLTA